DVLETHFFEHPCSEGGAAPTATIKHQLLILVSGHFVDIMFDHATRDRYCSRDRTACSLIWLTHIDQHEIVPGLLHLFELDGTYFLDFLLGFIHELVKLGQRHGENFLYYNHTYFSGRRPGLQCQKLPGSATKLLYFCLLP